MVIETREVYLGLQRSLGRLRRRIRWQEAVRWLPLTLSFGLLAGALVAFFARLNGSWGEGETWAAVGACIAGALALGLAVSFLRPRNEREIALHSDLAAGLDERLSTAVETQGRKPGNELERAMLALQLADAGRAADQIELPQTFPLRSSPLLAAVTIVCAGLLLVAFYAPNPFEAAARQQQAVSQAQQQVANRIEKVQKEIREAGSQVDPVREQALQELEKLRRDLEQGKLSREEAVARLGQSEQNLKQLQDPATMVQKEALNRLGQELTKFTDPSDLQQIGADLQLGNYPEAAQGLDSLARNLSQQSAAQRAAVAQALQQAADATANVDAELSQQLKAAADALKKGDFAAAQSALAQANERIRNNGASIATQQQLQKALGQLQSGAQSVAEAGKQTPQARQPAAPTALPGNGTATAGTPDPNSTFVAADGSPVAGTPVAGQSKENSGQQNGQQGQNGQGGQPQAGNQPGQPGQPGGKQPGKSAAGGGKGTNGGQREGVYAPEPNFNNQGTPLAVPVGGPARTSGNGSGTGKPVAGGGTGGTAAGSSSNAGGKSQVPYEDILGKYAQQAGTDLQNSYIPQGLKSYVRDYFTSLAPGSRQ